MQGNVFGMIETAANSLAFEAPEALHAKSRWARRRGRKQRARDRMSEICRLSLAIRYDCITHKTGGKKGPQVMAIGQAEHQR